MRNRGRVLIIVVEAMHRTKTVNIQELLAVVGCSCFYLA